MAYHWVMATRIESKQALDELRRMLRQAMLREQRQIAGRQDELVFEKRPT
jgi:hypothetical protein